MSDAGIRVRLVLVDEGSFHHEEILLTQEEMDGYERLIDCLREERSVLKRMYVDVSRLCAAYRVDEEA